MEWATGYDAAPSNVVVCTSFSSEVKPSTDTLTAVLASCQHLLLFSTNEQRAAIHPVTVRVEDAKPTAVVPVPSAAPLTASAVSSAAPLTAPAVEADSEWNADADEEALEFFSE